jgi:hypothetical protein
MRIFVGMKALRQDPHRLALAECVERSLRTAGHDVFIASAHISRLGLTDAQVFMPLVLREMQCCQAVLIIYQDDLRGGLIELGMAYALQLPIWLAAPVSAAHISSSALGCAHKLIVYEDLDDLDHKMKELCQ